MKVIGYDVGTTGFKAALYDISSEEIKMLKSVTDHYPLVILPNGGAEQDPEQWWRAMCRSTHSVLEKSGTDSSEIKGISCCSQCSTLVMVDEEGRALRPAMNIMDTRAQAQFRKGLQSGLKVMGFNAKKLITFLRATVAAPISAKDSVWRYNWVRDMEPDVFARTYKWLDTKEYLNARATGRIAASRDCAYMTFLYDVHTRTWSEKLCRIAGVDPKHLPDICDSTDIVGGVSEEAAAQLGLRAGTPVISGGIDVALCQVGAGALDATDVNICSGTSGWACVNTEKMKADVGNNAATIVGADPEMYLFTGDCETAGKCMEWVKERLADTSLSTYDDMLDAISGVPAGSNGIIFSPWMHGNRCPFEDANARGLFFNIDVDNHTGDMIKAVIEGVCFHMRWLLEVCEGNVDTSEVIKFSGGSAMSGRISQILADVLGRVVETTENPRQAGTMGAAAVTATALGVTGSIRKVKEMIKISRRFEPDTANTEVYDRMYPVFKEMHKNNRKAYAVLNEELKLN